MVKTRLIGGPILCDLSESVIFHFDFLAEIKGNPFSMTIKGYELHIVISLRITGMNTILRITSQEKPKGNKSLDFGGQFFVVNSMQKIVIQMLLFKHPISICSKRYLVSWL